MSEKLEKLSIKVKDGYASVGDTVFRASEHFYGEISVETRRVVNIYNSFDGFNTFVEYVTISDDGDESHSEIDSGFCFRDFTIANDHRQEKILSELRDQISRVECDISELDKKLAAKRETLEGLIKALDDLESKADDSNND